MHTPSRAQWSPKATRQLLPDSRLAWQRLARQRLARHRLPWIRLPRQPQALRPRRPRLQLPASSGPSLPPFFAAHSRPIPAPIFARSRPGLFPLFRPRPVPDSRPQRDRFLDRLLARFLPGFSLRSSSLLGPMPPILGHHLPPMRPPQTPAHRPPQSQLFRPPTSPFYRPHRPHRATRHFAPRSTVPELSGREYRRTLHPLVP